MSKQVRIESGSLYVATRYLETDSNKIRRVILTCKGEPSIVYWRYPEEAYTDPDILNNLKIAGYTASDLIVLAERLKDNGVDILTVRDYADGVRYGYERANADIERALRESVNRMLEDVRGSNNV
ncbi:MAG: hypothetical protein J6Q38_02175 [Clostridia bacterium]|nr:hypothetical protein [Clostridia bacterium]